MVLRTSILIALVSLLGHGLTAQSQLDAEALTTLIESSRLVDPNRYDEIRGTPYRYETFGPITIYDGSLEAYRLDSANYNGFTNQFEYYTAQGELRELSRDAYLRAEVPQAEGPPHNYGRGINPRYPDRYAQIIHRGETITATMIHDVDNDEKVVQDVGKTLRLRRFAHKDLHYAFVDGEFVILKLTPKEVAREIGRTNKKALAQFIKTNELRPDRPADLRLIYEEAERLNY